MDACLRGRDMHHQVHRTRYWYCNMHRDLCRDGFWFWHCAFEFSDSRAATIIIANSLPLLCQIIDGDVPTIGSIFCFHFVRAEYVSRAVSSFGSSKNVDPIEHNRAECKKRAIICLKKSLAAHKCECLSGVILHARK